MDFIGGGSATFIEVLLHKEQTKRTKAHRPEQHNGGQTTAIAILVDTERNAVNRNDLRPGGQRFQRLILSC